MFKRKVSKELIKRIIFDEDGQGTIFRLDQYLLPRNDIAPEYGFNRAERNITLYSIYLGEVFHGGHSLYFLNPSGDFYQRTLDGLEEMKLYEIKSILLEAINVFPKNEKMNSKTHREHLVKQFDSEMLDKFQELDIKLAKNQCSDRLLQYIRNNFDQILIEETNSKKAFE